jgi:hypothetical protein
VLDNFKPVDQPSHQRHNNNLLSSALNYPQLVEAHNIIQDEIVYKRFVELLEDCAMEGSLWPQVIARIYELIQSQRPQVWEQLGLLLDRVSRSRYRSLSFNKFPSYIFVD